MEIYKSAGVNFPDSATPEETLRNLLLELRDPVNSLKAWTEILDENPSDEQARAMSKRLAAYIASIHEKAKSYIESLDKKKSEE